MSKLLHIGIGNSYLANNLRIFYLIKGISISQNEIEHAKSQNITNYNISFLNKYKSAAFKKFKNEKFNFIIDTNIKSFACCIHAFENLFYQYYDLLAPLGQLITHTNGLKWTRIVKPKLAFSIKNFFYKKLKEYDGPRSNILTLKDCKKIAKNFNLNLDLSNKKLLIFKKN